MFVVSVMGAVLVCMHGAVELLFPPYPNMIDAPRVRRSVKSTSLTISALANSTATYQHTATTAAHTTYIERGLVPYAGLSNEPPSNVFMVTVIRLCWFFLITICIYLTLTQISRFLRGRETKSNSRTLATSSHNFVLVLFSGTHPSEDSTRSLNDVLQRKLEFRTRQLAASTGKSVSANLALAAEENRHADSKTRFSQDLESVQSTLTQKETDYATTIAEMQAKLHDETESHASTQGELRDVKHRQLATPRFRRAMNGHTWEGRTVGIINETVQAKEKEVDVLEKKVGELENKISELETSIHDHQQECKVAKQDERVAEMQKQCTKLEEHNSKLSECKTHLEEQAIEINWEVALLNMAKKEHQSALKQADRSLEIAEQKMCIQVLQGSNERLREESSKLSKSNSSLEAALADARAETARLSREVESQRAAVENATVGNKVSSAQAGRLTEANKALEEKIASLEQQKQRLVSESEQNGIGISDLQRALPEAEKRVVALEVPDLEAESLESEDQQGPTGFACKTVTDGEAVDGDTVTDFASSASTLISSSKLPATPNNSSRLGPKKPDLSKHKATLALLSANKSKLRPQRGRPAASPASRCSSCRTPLASATESGKCGRCETNMPELRGTPQPSTTFDPEAWKKYGESNESMARKEP